MNIAIIGYEVEGRASYTYFTKLGHTVTICDQDIHKQVPHGTPTQLGADYLHNLDGFDMVVRSAGIHPQIILAKNPGIETKITTAINEFLRVCPTKNVIGVTGTKGKGTTSTLITKMLEAAGKKVFLGGNIGRSPIDFIDDILPDDWVVLELSSFQLSDVRYSPHIGVCLMVVPEHLNWHADMDDYVAAKANMFRWQNQDDIAIFHGLNDQSKTIAGASKSQPIPYMVNPGAYVDGTTITIDEQAICDVSELKLLGAHNWENVCAAVTTVWQSTHNIEAIRSVATSFTGLPHRLEFARSINGVDYYNDSFASTPDAAIAGARAIKGAKVLIMGGFDRDLPIEHLAEAIKGLADESRVLLIGASAARVAKAFDGIGYTQYEVSTATNMDVIVAEATRLARGSGSVILSPGFPSFDMFKNFEDRGTQFKAIVEAIPKAGTA